MFTIRQAPGDISDYYDFINFLKKIIFFPKLCLLKKAINT